MCVTLKKHILMCVQQSSIHLQQILHTVSSNASTDLPWQNCQRPVYQKLNRISPGFGYVSMSALIGYGQLANNSCKSCLTPKNNPLHSPVNVVSRKVQRIDFVFLFVYVCLRLFVFYVFVCYICLYII